jgi:Domain of unknown function (DUF222)
VTPVNPAELFEEVSQVSTIPSPANRAQALEMMLAGARFLNAANATDMMTEEQGQCMQSLEYIHAMITAARSSILAAFIAARGHHADADYSPRSWLINRLRVTKGAATAYTTWAGRTATHPRVLEALAAAEVSGVSESIARTVCDWTDKLPEDCRDAADAILIAAARAGADQRDLAGLAGEIYARWMSRPDDDPDTTFDDRSVRLETTFDGAGVIRGDLTPDCAAVVAAVLDALSAPAGAEDTRTHEQRYHDALQDAMQRLLSAGLLPERAGQPVKALAHISLAELLAMDKDSALQDEWVTAVRARWAGARAAASVGRSDGAAWLDGDAARAVACDAMLVPVVTGDVDPGVLDDLVRLCVELARIGEGPDPDGAGPAAGPDTGPPALAREALQRAIIGKAVDLLSGPGGLASFLRREQLGAHLAGPSLPLDIGYSQSIPAGIRTAVILRDKHCQWSGGCNQPSAACQVHHVRHKANGGPTSVTACVLLCFFHHQVVIHRWGWTLVLNPDGTTTAWNPDRTKVLHSHSPPARAG